MARTKATVQRKNAIKVQANSEAKPSGNSEALPSSNTRAAAKRPANATTDLDPESEKNKKSHTEPDPGLSERYEGFMRCALT